MRDLTWSAGAYLAEFSNAAELSAAVRTFSEKGYTRIETYTPVPLEDGVHETRSRLPIAVFAAGLLGAIASYAIQWYANAHAYVQDIGGRPAHAIPAFMIPTFEGAVLAASLMAFAGFFFLARLPALWHPVFEIPGFERATVDRYWLAVDGTDRRSTPGVTVDELLELSPLRVLRLETAP
jgi:hypothetical protein